MNELLAPVIFVCVSVIAVLIGRWVAIRRNRPDQWHLQRGRCPSCKARKLVPTPMSASSVVLTCGQCEGQWFVIGADGQPIVSSLGRRVYVPPLTLYWQGYMTAVFETKMGFAKFDVSNTPIELMKDTSPREALRRLAAAGVQPISCQLNVRCDDPFPEFLESAGIDLPFDFNDVIDVTKKDC